MATITLLEPGYRTKYPPLGLMKLAAYHRGRNDTVHLRKGRVAPRLLDRPPERVYVATMFTYECSMAIRKVSRLVKGLWAQLTASRTRSVRTISERLSCGSATG